MTRASETPADATAAPTGPRHAARAALRRAAVEPGSGTGTALPRSGPAGRAVGLRARLLAPVADRGNALHPGAWWLWA
ncbi:energy-coupling factor transporter transmembrane protein EcfT, partial [Streptomyces hydrogenans]